MPIRVFAVDDSATIRQTLKLTLRGEEFDVETANDGVDALGKANAGYIPDIVLTDVNMPNMDGITLTAELRKLANYQKVPIIMVTTESQAEKKQAGKDAGATGWIVKPFSPEQLVALVKKIAG